MTKMDIDLLPRDGLILCAVSGGADSMYLLCRLRELGVPVAAAHFDHGLRGDESRRDAVFVADFCEKNAISFLMERGDVAAFAAREKLGIEAAARTMRYAFLERAADELGAAAIATAHTADDNAETVLLRLARGTGLKGLGGIPPVRGRVVRPMLDVTEKEVRAWLAEKGIPWVEDSTNASGAYARNRVRQGAVPVLETVNPAFARAVGRTAALVRADEAFLEKLARDFLAEHADENGVEAASLAAQPWPVASRAVRLLAGRDLAAEHVRAILKAAADGGAADAPGLRAVRTGDRLIFCGGPEPEPVSIPPRKLSVPGQVDVPEAGVTVRAAKFAGGPEDVHKSYNIFYFQCENICGSISVTGRWAGDTMRPIGRGCTKTMKQLFAEAGVPAWERAAVPVVRDEAGLLAVMGLGQDERAAARFDSGEIIKIEFQRHEP